MPPLPPPLSLIDLKLLSLILAGAAAIAGLFMLWRWERRRRARAARAAAVTRCGVEFLRDVAGNIFGGDQMSEWTVMQRAHRFTFVNPQTGLYDRIAAVRALAPELPVEGRIVFTPRGRFPKGLPRHTLMLESLPAEFPNTAPDAIRPLLDQWMPTWNVVRKSVAPSRLAAPKPAI